MALYTHLRTTNLDTGNPASLAILMAILFQGHFIDAQFSTKISIFMLLMILVALIVGRHFILPTVYSVACEHLTYLDSQIPAVNLEILNFILIIAPDY